MKSVLIRLTFKKQKFSVSSVFFKEIDRFLNWNNILQYYNINIIFKSNQKAAWQEMLL